MRYIIQDWAGNLLFNGREFKTFEDGWECVYEYVRTIAKDDEDYESWLGEYYVLCKECETTNTKDKTCLYHWGTHGD